MHPVILTWPAWGLTVRSYGAMILLGVLTAYLSARSLAGRRGADPRIMRHLFFILVIGGVLGSRLFYVAHFRREFFTAGAGGWEAVRNLDTGGREIYGGILLAVLGIVVYLRIRGESLLPYLDALAPSAILVDAFGRIGCFAHGCCWGVLCLTASGHAAQPWAVRFPAGSPAYVQHQALAAEAQRVQSTGEREACADPVLRAWQMATPPGRPHPLTSLPVHPTQLYSSIVAFGLFGVCFGAARAPSRPGTAFLTVLALHPLSRVILEVWRGDNPHDTFGLSIHSALSILLSATGMLCLIAFRVRAAPACRAAPSGANVH